MNREADFEATIFKVFKDGLDFVLIADHIGVEYGKMGPLAVIETPSLNPQGKRYKVWIEPIEEPKAAE